MENLRKQENMKYSIYYKIFSYMPLINLLALLLLITHSFFLYGRMPSYSNPDPKTLFITYSIFQISEIIVFFSFIIFPSLFIVVILQKTLTRRILFKHIIIYAFSIVLVFIIYRIEILDLGTWIID